MMPLEFETPIEVAKAIAGRCKEKRLFLNLSQKSLSGRSGVSASVIKQFERTGKISLESLLKLALAFGALADFRVLFKEDLLKETLTLNQLLAAPKQRKRGRL